MEAALSVLMPVYNEERWLAVILGHVLARPEVGELIAVDDGSTDRSLEILDRAAASDPRLHVIRQDRNRGKGAAVRRAIEAASLPFALIQDADLEYDPRDYPMLLEPLLEGRTDVVYGVRGFSNHSAYNYWFVLGNRLVSWVTNLLFNCYISDMETGYKIMRTDLWKRVHLSRDRFDIEPEVTARVLRLGYRIHEVPIRYYARGRDEGKKLTWVDGVRALAVLLRLRLGLERGPRDDPGYHRKRQQELARYHPLVSSRDQE
ncbi:MAG: glycosyltransferase family 2 protein [Candidatus Dormibacteraeota bacterium]|nr:glycosyltransferase family 2 protein [Candidatus Dormibacteraeota bacterium]